MYRNTRFAEVMKALPRGQFEKLVDKYGADKHSKGFRCHDQLMAMVFGQLTGSRSLRELELAFNSHRTSHYHLGTRPDTDRKSTRLNSSHVAISYAVFCLNKKRSTSQ